jgi:hypothetical protein
LVLTAALGAAQAADFTPEQVTVAKLLPATPTRLYVSDVAISHIIDARLYIGAGDTR